MFYFVCDISSYYWCCDYSSHYIYSTDETPTGHALGSPDGRSNTLPERGLSPAVCCILRALMHSALLWASCNTQVQWLILHVCPHKRSSPVLEYIYCVLYLFMVGVGNIHINDIHLCLDFVLVIFDEATLSGSVVVK